VPISASYTVIIHQINCYLIVQFENDREAPISGQLILEISSNKNERVPQTLLLVSVSFA